MSIVACGGWVYKHNCAYAGKCCTIPPVRVGCTNGHRDQHLERSGGVDFFKSESETKGGVCARVCKKKGGGVSYK